MAEPPLEKFVSLGYRITRYVEPSVYGEAWWAEHGRDRWISLSTCLAGHIPDVDPLDDANPDDPIIDWYGRWNATDYFWPNEFGSLAAARDFVARILAEDPRRLILGLGLHRDDYARFLGAAPTMPLSTVGGSVSVIAEQNCRLAAGGTDVGYDVLSYESHLDHSWYCGGHDVEVREKFGIVANDHGLIETYEEARQVADYIDAPDTSSEPGLWVPIRILRYSET